MSLLTERVTSLAPPLAPVMYSSKPHTTPSPRPHVLFSLPCLPGVIGIFNEMCHHHMWGWANGRDRRSCGRRSGCTDRPQKRILITLSHAKASGGFAVTSAASAIDVVPRAGRARPPRRRGRAYPSHPRQYKYSAEGIITGKCLFDCLISA